MYTKYMYYPFPNSCYLNPPMLPVVSHWLSGRARGFNPQGHGFISHPVDQYVCTGKSQSLWDRVLG
jgi:hypothetical protein